MVKAMNLPVHGYNEWAIMYILAAAPTMGYLPRFSNEAGHRMGQISPHMVEGIKLHLRYQGTEAGPLFLCNILFWA